MKLKNMIGQKFGKLLVLERVENHYYPSGRHDAQYKCQCECGNIITVLGTHLRSGHTSSCGCYRADIARQHLTTHGMSDTRLYIIWKNMKARCYHEKHPRYKDYGKRGIKVSKKWKNDFEAFAKWALKHGYANNLTIDRIDNNDNYRPKNCRWVSLKIQANNTRRNVYLTYHGETHTMKEWSELLLLDYKLLKDRIERGWSTEKAFETPVKK